MFSLSKKIVFGLLVHQVLVNVVFINTTVAAPTSDQSFENYKHRERRSIAHIPLRVMARSSTIGEIIKPVVMMTTVNVRRHAADIFRSVTDHFESEKEKQLKQEQEKDKREKEQKIRRETDNTTMTPTEGYKRIRGKRRPAFPQFVSQQLLQQQPQPDEIYSFS